MVGVGSSTPYRHRLSDSGCGKRLRFRFAERSAFKRLALAIEAIELFSDPARFCGLFDTEQPRAKGGIADSSASIDAGTD